MERCRLEKEQWQIAKEKLMEKLQQQSAEIKALQQHKLDADAMEQKYIELMTHAEHAALDKEMAEEKTEALQTDVETLQLQLEEAQLELEVLREEQAALANGPLPASVLESKQIERYRTYLVRLRETTQASEKEMQSKVQTLEASLTKMEQITRNPFFNINQTIMQENI